MTRGEVRWYTFRLPDKRRPVLVLTRDEVLDCLNEISVAPVTRTVRGLRTEVPLTEEDGMPTACAVNFDHISLGQRDRFGSVLCNLSPERWAASGEASARNTSPSTSTTNVPPPCVRPDQRDRRADVRLFWPLARATRHHTPARSLSYRRDAAALHPFPWHISIITSQPSATGNLWWASQRLTSS